MSSFVASAGSALSYSDIVDGSTPNFSKMIDLAPLRRTHTFEINQSDYDPMHVIKSGALYSNPHTMSKNEPFSELDNPADWYSGVRPMSINESSFVPYEYPAQRNLAEFHPDMIAKEESPFGEFAQYFPEVDLPNSRNLAIEHKTAGLSKQQIDRKVLFKTYEKAEDDDAEQQHKQAIDDIISQLDKGGRRGGGGGGGAGEKKGGGGGSETPKSRRGSHGGGGGDDAAEPKTPIGRIDRDEKGGAEAAKDEEEIAEEIGDDATPEDRSKFATRTSDVSGRSGAASAVERILSGIPKGRNRDKFQGKEEFKELSRAWNALRVYLPKNQGRSITNIEGLRSRIKRVREDINDMQRPTGKPPVSIQEGKET